MGTYYKLINVTKREQYEPPNIKLDGFTNPVAAAQIVALLTGPWREDEVRFVSDGFIGRRIFGGAEIDKDADSWWETVDAADGTPSEWRNRYPFVP